MACHCGRRRERDPVLLAQLFVDGNQEQQSGPEGVRSTIFQQSCKRSSSIVARECQTKSADVRSCWNTEKRSEGAYQPVDLRKEETRVEEPANQRNVDDEMG